MEKKWHFIILALIFGAASFFLTRILWPDPAGTMGPSPLQFPFFFFLGIAGSLSFGSGMAFLILAPSLVKKFKLISPRLAWASYICLGWFLVSWWPHENFHRIMTTHDFQMLLYIEYGFHLTSQIAALITAFAFYSIIKNAGNLRRP